MNRVLLCFSDADDETAFQSVHQEMLPRAMQATSALSCTSICVFFLPVLKVERGRHDNPFRFDDTDARMGWFYVCFTALLVSIATLLYATLKVRGWIPRPVDNMELFGLFCICVVANSCMYMDRWQMAEMYGQDPLEVWAGDIRGASGTALLALDIFVTAVSLFIPIRVARVWVVHASVLVLYVLNSACFGQAFPEQTRLRICFMVVLAGLAYFGAWRNESAARKQWQSLQKQLNTVRVQKHEISQQQIELDESSALARGMQSVLTGLCDVVFKLCPDCRVLGANSARDSVFGCKMEGRNLLDFFADKGSTQRFHGMLQKSRETGLLQMMSLSCVRHESFAQAPFDAEFFVAEMAGAQSAHRYLLGMRMMGEQAVSYGVPFDDDIPSEANDIVASLPNCIGPESEVSFDFTDADSASQPRHKGEMIAQRPRMCDDTRSLTYSQSALSQSSGPSIQLVRIPTADAQVQAGATHSEASSMTYVGMNLLGFRCSRCDKPPTLPRRRLALGADVAAQQQQRKKAGRSNSCPSSSRRALAVPGYEATPDSTCAFLAEHAMHASNLALSPAACCLWHQYAREFESRFSSYRSEQCQPAWQPWSALQCPECYGLQPEVEDMCTVCSADLSWSSRAAASGSRFPPDCRADCLS